MHKKLLIIWVIHAVSERSMTMVRGRGCNHTIAVFILGGSFRAWLARSLRITHTLNPFSGLCLAETCLELGLKASPIMAATPRMSSICVSSREVFSSSNTKLHSCPARSGAGELRALEARAKKTKDSQERHLVCLIKPLRYLFRKPKGDGYTCVSFGTKI